ncbi:MAG TPA: pyruvate, phosphate dikinase [Terriglobales bacterium]|nr:pyruvate, phosphate dikinase [Terriglobales bacterium]
MRIESLHRFEGRQMVQRKTGSGKTFGKKPQYIYFFGEGKAEGKGSMKAELGGKGAGLAEMTLAGLPVPPGFTIQTEACRYYLREGRSSAELDRLTKIAMKRLETMQGQQLGAGTNPLLVSVRSGAKDSMPGMMDTILNLGLNDVSVKSLAERTGNPRFAYDSYRRLIQMFGDVVMEVPKQAFDEIFDSAKKRRKVTQDTSLDASALHDIAEEFKKAVKAHSRKAFPQDPTDQLMMARDAVFRSWNTDRARTYRRINHIPDDLGTAVTVQAMVFGNLGETSGTGVGFTRNPATGAKEFYGEFLMNAQGEDVVAGIRTPVPIAELNRVMPNVFTQLREITSRLERHYKDMQDFEFTIQEGKLYMLQTRSGKRTGRAAVHIALDMVNEGLIDQRTAIFRVEPNQLYDFLLPHLDEKSSVVEVIAHGLPASPGAAVGQIVFTAQEAVEKAGPQHKNPVILVRAETTPEDIHGMEVAVGILTSRGGMTSHAAVVTRGMGKCCVAGAGELGIDENLGEMKVKDMVFHSGDWISLDGTTGRVIKGKLSTLPATPDVPELQKFMSWAEPYRDMQVRANADIPRDAIQARAFGAEGIGLCRTEHMFFAEDRIEHMRTMIMATTPADRKEALSRLLPMQRSDFLGIFRAMDGFPVTIRLLDPPLHEFLPRRENLMSDVAVMEVKNPKSSKLKDMYRVLARVDDLHEINPMLGHRGCRLGITDPEISEMQARAIFEAAVMAAKEGVKVTPEVMVPLVSSAKEMAHQAAIIRRVAEEVFTEKNYRVKFLVGTMLELPRAAMAADEIAKEAEFFSFGTNDLTQTTFGFSRDDINKFLPSYLSQGLLKHDPFAVLDRAGVGKLMQIACDLGRKSREGLKIGICGEHGGEPSSVEFCHGLNLDYVSCSPFRVLTARLAAAQAAAAKNGAVKRRPLKRKAAKTKRRPAKRGFAKKKTAGKRK